MKRLMLGRSARRQRLQVSSQTGQGGHSSSQLTWNLQIPSRSERCAHDVETQGLEEHSPQLYLAMASLVTVKNAAVNNGLEAWRGLNGTNDSHNRGRQPRDGRMRRERVRKKIRQDVGLDEKIGVILAWAPPRMQNHCHLNSHILRSHAQVRTTLPSTSGRSRQ